MNKKDLKNKRKRATLREVAKHAQVSVATVSYVLNDSGSVGDDVKQRVLNSVKELGYRPNRSAQAMRTGRTKTIGLILPDLRNPFFPELAQSVEISARDSGFSVFLVDTQNDLEAEQDGFDRLTQHGVEGIVWCPTSQKDTLAKHPSDLPIVVIDRPLPNYDTVASEYYHGGSLMAQHVLSQGHRKIGMINGPQVLKSASERRRGFVDAIQSKAEIVWEVENPFSVDLLPKVDLRVRENLVTIIVAGNDLIAVGALQVLNDANIGVPTQVSLAGFDDIAWCQVVTPALTTVRQPTSELGHEAVSLLTRRIGDPDAPRRQVTLDVSLIVRDSIAKV